MSELPSTALEIEENDENIERITERKTLLNETRKRVKTPSCRTMLCKALVLTVAGILFILMMVELWGDYGNVIQTHTLFKPTVYSIMETCPPNAQDGTRMTKQYNSLVCDWDVQTNATSLHCNGTMPANAFVLPSVFSGYSDIEVMDDSLCITWEGVDISRCVRLLIYSI